MRRMADRRTIEELSLTELEQVLVTRRREERMRRLRERGIERELPDAVAPAPEADTARLPSLPRRPAGRGTVGKAPPSWKARLLTVVEVLALVGFVAAGSIWYWETRQTDLQEAEPAVLSQSESAAEEVSELPGNPPPPSDASPIPPLYQAWIQPEADAATIPQGNLSDQRPTRIVIPKLSVDAPVVPGDDWESLKRGAGHHPGSANPGERGNLVISAHNDIFGELFRYLDKLEPGDQFTIYDAMEREYLYEVRTKRIVEPTEVSVLASSPEPLATLITCYPYLVDSQRLVVQAELLR